jgi:hypothetical protein
VCLLVSEEIPFPRHNGVCTNTQEPNKQSVRWKNYMKSKQFT